VILTKNEIRIHSRKLAAKIDRVLPSNDLANISADPWSESRVRAADTGRVK
jgi:hypothetical protein